MAATRHTHPSSVVSGGSPQHRLFPVSHSVHELDRPDEDGFVPVRSRRRWCRRSPPRESRPVPPGLVGLCFNCLVSSHVKAGCTFPVRCFNCWCEGHRAHACPLPSRSAAVKRGRSLPGQLGHRSVSRRAPKDGARRSREGDDDTLSTRSVSTGRSTSVPRCCRPPTPPVHPNPRRCTALSPAGVQDPATGPGLSAIQPLLSCRARRTFRRLRTPLTWHLLPWWAGRDWWCQRPWWWRTSTTGSR